MSNPHVEDDDEVAYASLKALRLPASNGSCAPSGYYIIFICGTLAILFFCFRVSRLFVSSFALSRYLVVLALFRSKLYGYTLVVFS